MIARGRQRVFVEQDLEYVARAEQRKEARPISHIGQETNGRTKARTRPRNRQEARAQMKAGKKVRTAACGREGRV